MGLSLALLLFGLALAGYGLAGPRIGQALVAPLGWIVFLAGVVRLIVPGFF